MATFKRSSTEVKTNPAASPTNSTNLPELNAPEVPGNRRSYARMGFAMLAAILAIEGVGRVAEQRLPPEPKWGSPLAATHAQNLARGPIDVLVVGSSSAGVALPGLRVAEAAGLRSGYTPWIPGATMEHVEMLTFAMAFKPAPCLLVIGTTMREFNGKGSAADTGRDVRENREYQKARGNTIEKADAFLRDVSATARLRRWFSKPRDLLSNLKNPQPEVSIFKSGPDGRFINNLDGVLATQPAGHLEQERKELLDYELDPRHLQTLTKVIRRATESGSLVIVVNVPTHPNFHALAPRGETDYEQYLAAVTKTAIDAGVMFLDPSTPTRFTDLEFRDVNHVNERGTQRLLRSIQPELRAAVAATKQPRCTEARN